MEVDDEGISLLDFLDGIREDTTKLLLVSTIRGQINQSYKEFFFGLQIIDNNNLKQVEKVTEILYEFANTIYLHLNNYGQWNDIKSCWDLFLTKFGRSLNQKERLNITLQLAITKNNLGLYQLAENDFQTIISALEKDNNFWDILPSAFFQMGVCQVRQNKFKNAQSYLEKCIASCSPSQKQIQAFAFIQIGNIRMLEGNPREAESSYKKSNQIFDEINESRNLACTAYDALGRLYVLEQKYTEAIPYLEKGLAIRRRRNELSGEINASVQLADAYIGINNLNTAEELLEEVSYKLESSEKNLIDPVGKTLVLVSLGRLSKAKGQSIQALSYWERAVKENKGSVPSVDLRILSLLIPELAARKRIGELFRYLFLFVSKIFKLGIGPLALLKLLLSYIKGILSNKFKNKNLKSNEE